MPTFLELVARDLYAKVGNNLSRTAVVFPNKRARLFFNEHLAAQTDRPLWSPAYISISELFGQLSPWKAGDPIRLVCELYRVFREETQSTETLDDFYFWGELLISDFDDVDKNLVDAGRLFGNLQDLHNIMNDYNFLDREQEEAIRQFFQNFSIERRTLLKERFISLWDKLGAIYQQYRRRLEELGIAYEGMMYRHVLETLDIERLKYDRYVFVGFNVLNRVETRFFERLHEAGRAMFYWDYDLFYTRLPRESVPPYTHEAGEFIVRNLQRFPNELPEECFDTMRQPKQIRFIASPTENAQARWIAQEITREQGTKESAIVLCNEHLLQPVLHAIPAAVQHINITMGFPLSQTPAYSLLIALVELQTKGYRPDSGRYQYDAVAAVLKHPYVRQLSDRTEALEQRLKHDNRFFPLPSELMEDEYLSQLFTPRPRLHDLCLYLTEQLRRAATLYHQKPSVDIFDQLYREALFQSYTIANRLGDLVGSGELPLQTDTLVRLLTQLLAAAGIPFHGEPAIGLQVMGLLETRNLDFRNLIMLSVNEGKLPGSGNDASFVPYNLRKAFGMTTIEHKNAVYAYYFYRLMQRAERITLLYNTSTDGMNRGEMSRFMLQLLVESPHAITQLQLEAGQSPQSGRPAPVRKTIPMLEHLYERHRSGVLSPSALNTYLDCRLKFYYRYVAGLKAPDEVSIEIDSALFGTLFHRAAQLAYTDLTATGKEIRKEELERLLKADEQLQAYVDWAFKETFFHIPLTDKSEYNGTQLINARVVKSYLAQLLRNDLLYAPFRMEGMERAVRETLTIDTPLGERTLQIGGIIDRLDSKQGTLRIVDYKTGGMPKTLHSVEQLFRADDEQRPGYIFQTFLYAAIMSRQQPQRVAPALLYIHRAASDDYSPVIRIGAPRQPKLPVDDFSPYEAEFRDHLHQLLQEIYNPDEDFTPTKCIRRCEYCDFRRLCRL
ncbi:MAG: PD-(D/E)XK nuclease family protein [Prevotellaceae bacterium]|jgi:CRISPR/Cas system-associated exonuclease Cas4 (RecB family)|nr:PD-(D/E)XK nuclease family protein [Prevotellaceae bacterium]